MIYVNFYQSGTTLPNIGHGQQPFPIPRPTQSLDNLSSQPLILHSDHFTKQPAKPFDTDDVLIYIASSNSRLDPIPYRFVSVFLVQHTVSTYTELLEWYTSRGHKLPSYIDQSIEKKSPLLICECLHCELKNPPGLTQYHLSSLINREQFNGVPVPIHTLAADKLLRLAGQNHLEAHIDAAKI